MIASHSSCRDLSNHPRNMSDQMIRDLAKQGGVIQITFVDSVSGRGASCGSGGLDPEAADFRCGEAETGPGADPPGQLGEDRGPHRSRRPGGGGANMWVSAPISTVRTCPSGMEDVSFLPKITGELLKRGYDEGQIRLILGENTMRVLQAGGRGRRQHPVPGGRHGESGSPSGTCQRGRRIHYPAMAMRRLLLSLLLVPVLVSTLVRASGSQPRAHLPSHPMGGSS